MKFFHPSRFVAAIVALVSMLFMQLAVAGYVCPEFEEGYAAEAAATVQHGHELSLDCIGTDAEQSNLCQAHGTFGNESVDTQNAAPVPPFIPAVFILALQKPVSPHLSFKSAMASPPLTRTIEPALAIQHCCFRI
jgi:hypothetical protein